MISRPTVSIYPSVSPCSIVDKGVGSQVTRLNALFIRSEFQSQLGTLFDYQLQSSITYRCGWVS